MTKVQKPSVIYDDNQGAFLLANNMQVGMNTKHIDIGHTFLRDMVEDKDIDIHYIWSEDNLAEITTKNTSKSDCMNHMKRMTEGELWELMDTRRQNVNHTRVADNAINHDKTEYSSHALAEAVDGDHM